MIATLMLCAAVAAPPEIPFGDKELTLQLALEEDGETQPIVVFTHKPEGFNNGPALLVCHGVLRNAKTYRDDARAMAKRFGALVVAPYFPEKEFPIDRYQFGGVAVTTTTTSTTSTNSVVATNDGGRMQTTISTDTVSVTRTSTTTKPRSYWSGNFVPPLIAEIRRLEDRKNLPCYCIGHSGGAQFLARMAGFVQSEASRIVVANAGTHLFPSRELPYPFGFGGLPEELSSDAVLKAYLARPMTIYLGTKDTERDVHFDRTPPAEKQGQTRFERGRNCWLAGQALAKEKDWDFGWKLVEAEGVSHDHTKMFNHDKCQSALLGK